MNNPWNMPSELAHACRERHMRVTGTTELLEQAQKWSMRRWIGRYRALIGPNRPLVVQLKHKEGVWVLPPGGGPQYQGGWIFSRLNVQDATWELGAHAWEGLEAIVSVLDPTEKLVRRVWAKQVMKRLA